MTLSRIKFNNVSGELKGYGAEKPVEELYKM